MMKLHQETLKKRKEEEERKERKQVTFWAGSMQQ